MLIFYHTLIKREDKYLIVFGIRLHMAVPRSLLVPDSLDMKAIAMTMKTIWRVITTDATTMQQHQPVCANICNVRGCIVQFFTSA